MLSKHRDVSAGNCLAVEGCNREKNKQGLAK
jgi:hypothetical protein